MANLIFRGPVTKEPVTINLPTAAADYLPGTFVTSDGSELTLATTAEDQEVYLLSNRRFMEQDLDTVYANGDTAIAYVIEAGYQMQARLAAATYTAGQPLTVAALGRLAAAASGDPIVAYFDGTPGAFTAGALADVRIANSSAKA